MTASEDDTRQRRRVVAFVDAAGKPTSAAAEATSGEIVEVGDETRPTRRTWFIFEEVEIPWLPVSEGAFLLWVLAFLVAVWIAIGIVLHLT